MENNNEALYPGGVQVNTMMEGTRKEAPAEIQLDTVVQQIEVLLMRRNARWPHSDFILQEVSGDGYFLYDYVDDQGKLTTYKARWSTEHGYVTVSFTEQSVIETNAGMPLYPVGMEFTDEELANIAYADKLIAKEIAKNEKLPREYAEDQEPLYPNTEL